MNRPEESLQRSIVQLWKVIGRHDVQMQADATGMIGLKRRLAAWAMGTRAGWPDLTFIDAQGRCYFIECKSVNGKLTVEQILFLEWCRINNIPHLVCRDLEQAREFWALHGLFKESLQTRAA